MKKIFLFFFLLLLSGCSGDNFFQGTADTTSDDAVIGDAAIALDGKDYDGVISTLSSIYDTTDPEPRVARLMGAAYMGKAGIDVTYYISMSADPYAGAYDAGADLLNLNAASRDAKGVLVSDIADLTLLVTSGGAKYVSGYYADDMIGYLDKAKKAFKFLGDTKGLTDEDYIQYGLATAVHFVLISGNAVAKGLNYDSSSSNYSEGAVPVPINKQAYIVDQMTNNTNAYKIQDWPTGVHASTFGVNKTNPTYSTYQEDLIEVYHAIQAFDRSEATSTQNNVRNRLEAFLENITGMSAGEINESTISSTVTSAGLFEYFDKIETK